MECTICGRNAVIERKHEGRALCRKHFLDSVDKAVRRAIRTKGYVARGGHVAVCMSSGKSASLLLYELIRLKRARGDIKISAVCVDEGIRGYSKKKIATIKKMCDERGITLHTVPYKDVFGFTLDEALKGRERKYACAYCRKFLDDALDEVLRKISADCLAVASTMDDEVSQITADYFGYGSVPDDARAAAGHGKGHDTRVKTIKPVSDIPENEIKLYVQLKGLDGLQAKCPYEEVSFRSRISTVLRSLEEKHPGVKYNILRSRDKMDEILRHL